MCSARSPECVLQFSQLFDSQTQTPTSGLQSSNAPYQPTRRSVQYIFMISFLCITSTDRRVCSCFRSPSLLASKFQTALSFPNNLQSKFELQHAVVTRSNEHLRVCWETPLATPRTLGHKKPIKNYLDDLETEPSFAGADWIDYFPGRRQSWCRRPHFRNRDQKTRIPTLEYTLDIPVTEGTPTDQKGYHTKSAAKPWQYLD